ncbi:apolipoprotein D and lipocalin family protein [Pedobacter sp. UYP30]|uniref:lipocalin family protein n=1 Tax=Pedobacter sp. UYP30 TaxID=1756400 RepID=UPI00339AE596
MKKETILLASSAVLLAGLSTVLMSGCVSIPKNATAVQPFIVHKYLGKWYEIARFDYRFEKNLNNVTAEYSLNDDGSIKVTNRGFDVKQDKWKETIGKAQPVKNSDEARLKVSFFGPFYAGYNVVKIDKEYKYALVAGNNLDYLWILSREKTIPEDIKEAYVKAAQEIGYDTNKLVWVKQDKG